MLGARQVFEETLAVMVVVALHLPVALGKRADTDRVTGAFPAPSEAVGGEQAEARACRRGGRPLGLTDAGDGQGGGLGLAGASLQDIGFDGRGVEKVEVRPALGQVFRLGQVGIGVFGSDPGHGHGARREGFQAGVGHIRSRHDGLAASDEDPQADIQTRRGLDVFQGSATHANARRGGLDGQHIMRVRARLTRGPRQRFRDRLRQGARRRHSFQSSGTAKVRDR